MTKEISFQEYSITHCLCNAYRKETLNLTDCYIKEDGKNEVIIFSLSSVTHNKKVDTHTHTHSIDYIYYLVQTIY